MVIGTKIGFHMNSGIIANVIIIIKVDYCKQFLWNFYNSPLQLPHAATHFNPCLQQEPALRSHNYIIKLAT